ncbi:class I SAM-dependent methyltransferase [Halobellus rubicundus]|uniref:Class I SAM-dependent methyltransferase n=1 Tax=Halobellus rubicundus TaxID=2996466 RepID=A0ABD5MC72_9EURY
MVARRPPTFADACRAVLDDPAGDHAADTTLAPIHARTVPETWGERRAHLVRTRFPADVERVLELGCGIGALLGPLSARYDVVGVDDARAYLRFPAARGEAVVRGWPTDPPVGAAFDAACVLERSAARYGPLDLCVAAYGSLRPGGIVVVAAPTDPDAVIEPGVETYSGARYFLERAVDVAGDGTAVVDYRVTDRRTGDAAVATERRTVATTSADGLAAALQTAGFEDVLVSGESDLPGLVVGRGVRPVETGAAGADLEALPSGDEERERE